MNGAILVSALLVLSCGTYVIWPSRWNIPAHTSLAFWVVAYLVPIAFVRTHGDYPDALVTEFANVCAIGAVAYLAGLLIGASLRGKDPGANLLRRIASNAVASPETATRAAIVTGAAVVVLLYAIIRMGFVPMFADDPFSAKFFRGEYAASYQPVAIPYRAGTSLLGLLIPVAAAYALRRRSLAWRTVLIMSVGLMLVTLQRGPAAAGLLTFIGVWLIARGRLALFVLASFAVYVGGTLSYAFLSLLGVIPYSFDLSNGGILPAVASTVPDVSDALSFLGRWHSAGEPLTSGRTFYGGLIPGNYPWNPGVWTLTLGNTGVDLSTISSGGLRLPDPLWGLVSFGWIGVALVPLAGGIISGWLTMTARSAMATTTEIEARVWILVVYGVLTACLAGFETMSYVVAIQAFVALWIAGAFARRGEGGLIEGRQYLTNLPVRRR